MIGNLILIVQFIIGMSIIVGIHELGHLLMAKLFGMRVESYGIGMPPKIFSKTFGETEYYFGAVPFGGAVVISGMVEEEDKKDIAPKNYEFSSKPAWQRLIVILGGIIFNFISSIIVFSAIFFFEGRDTIKKDSLNCNGIVPTELGESIGLLEGDKILKLNGKSDFVISYDGFICSDYNIVVSRDGKELQLSGKIDLEQLSDKTFFMPRVPFYIESLVEGGPAKRAGLMKGDEIIEIANIKTPYLHNLLEVLLSHKNCTVNLIYKRAGELNSTQVTISDRGTLDIMIETKIEKNRSYLGLTESFSLGIEKFEAIILGNLRGLYMILTGKISFSKSVSGPIGIAKSFGESFELSNFFNKIGILSAVIGLMNLLPFPALDGGHCILILLEMIFRKKLSSSVANKIQYLGVGLLLMLAAFTVVNDILKFF